MLSNFGCKGTKKIAWMTRNLRFFYKNTVLSVFLRVIQAVMMVFVGLLLDNQYKASTWLGGYLTGQLIALGDEPVLLGCQLILGRIGIGKQLYAVVATTDKAQVYVECHLIVGTVDTGYIPGVAATTGQYDALAREA